MTWTRLAVATAFLTATGCAPQDADDTGLIDTADTLGTATDFTPEPPQDRQARVELRDTAGNLVGTATLEDEDGGVRLQLTAQGLTPGEHGIHFHAVGQCDAAGETPFASAGDHFNPTNAQHGLENPQGPHAGDLPNLEAGDDGTVDYEETTDMVSLLDGATNSLLDADGTALIIHADADDMQTDPSGNSGGRIACGVVEQA